MMAAARSSGRPPMTSVASARQARDSFHRAPTTQACKQSFVRRPSPARSNPSPAKNNVVVSLNSSRPNSSNSSLNSVPSPVRPGSIGSVRGGRQNAAVPKPADRRCGSRNGNSTPGTPDGEVDGARGRGEPQFRGANMKKAGSFQRLPVAKNAGGTALRVKSAVGNSCATVTTVNATAGAMYRLRTLPNASVGTRTAPKNSSVRSSSTCSESSTSSSDSNCSSSTTSSAGRSESRGEHPRAQGVIATQRTEKQDLDKDASQQKEQRSSAETDEIASTAAATDSESSFSEGSTTQAGHKHLRADVGAADPTDPKLVGAIMEILGFPSANDAMFARIARSLLFLSKCGYSTADICCVVAHATVYFSYAFRKRGQQMDALEIANVFVLALFVAHSYVLDETASLKTWHSSLFNDYCTLPELDSAVVRVFRFCGFKLRLEDGILEHRYDLLCEAVSAGLVVALP